MDKVTLYWLFSTAPQALAAIIGIVFTGLFFMSGNIDNRVREDPTLSEIGDEAKTIMHRNMKVIAVFNIIAIVFDLMLIAVTNRMIDEWSDWSDAFVDAFAVLNLSAIIVTFYYVFDIVNPKYFDKIANNLSKAYQQGTVDPYEFVRNFSEFEKVARDRLNLNQAERFIPIHEVLNMLIADRILARDDISNFYDMRKVRNLILHEHYNQQVSKELNDELLRLTAKIAN